MVYHAICERLKPLRSVDLSLYSLNIVGVEDSIHAVGSMTEILSVVFSKSSIYDALS